jgi:hypothetical protein
MPETRAFEGGCLCGAVRYLATAAPVRGVICHCPMCRRHSGAPALAFVHFPANQFSWTRGEPRLYASSEFARRGFCGTCGSTLSMHEDVLADRMLIAVGSLDEPARAKIEDHVWTKDQLPWFRIDDGLPRFAANSSRVPTQATLESTGKKAD